MEGQSVQPIVSGRASASISALVPRLGEVRHDLSDLHRAFATPWWARTMRSLVLASSDTAAFLLSAAVAYFAWAQAVRGQPSYPYMDVVFFVPLLLIGFLKSGLYPGFGVGAVETLRRMTMRVTFLFMVIASMSFVFRLPHHYSRMTFLIAWVLTLVLIPVFRFTLLNWLKDVRWWPEPVIVFGSGDLARRIVRALSGAVSMGYKPVAVVQLDDRDDVEQLEGVPVCSFAEVLSCLRGTRVALLANDEMSTSAQAVQQLQQHFQKVIHLRGWEEFPVEGVQFRNLGGVLGIEYSNQLVLPGNQFVKRSIDLVMGGLMSLVAMPVLMIAGAVIKMVDPGPVFYRQRREGLLGEPLDVLKLRTMYCDAETRLEELLAGDPEARQEWEERMKLKNDPRILPWIGNFLRRFSLDELPQVFQVVRGQMSLVGPRPFPEYHLAHFDAEFRELRSQVRPGLSGLWQVTTRSDGCLEDQLLHDTHYIRNWSLWMDLYILGRTCWVVLFSKGAY